MAQGGSGRRDSAVFREQDRQSGQTSSSKRIYGLPKSVRLLRTSDYRKVYAEGRRRNLGVLVAFSRMTGDQPSRVGMAVSKAFGGAVDRNRLKRRLREAVRRNRPELGPGWDIIFHPRTQAKQAKFSDLEAAVRDFFETLRRQAKTLAAQSSRRKDS